MLSLTGRNHRPPPIEEDDRPRHLGRVLRTRALLGVFVAGNTTVIAFPAASSEHVQGAARAFWALCDIPR